MRVELLRVAASLLFDHLEATGGAEVKMSNDYFWSIPPEQRHDPRVEPTEFTIGQISECIVNLEEVVADPDRVLNFGLVWLGQILESLGETARG